jgi:hypothetical protein
MTRAMCNRSPDVSVGVAIYSDEFKDGAVKQVLEGGYPV